MERLEGSLSIELVANADAGSLLFPHLHTVTGSVSARAHGGQNDLAHLAMPRLARVDGSIVLGGEHHGGNIELAELAADAELSIGQTLDLGGAVSAGELGRVLIHNLAAVAHIEVSTKKTLGDVVINAAATAACEVGSLRVEAGANADIGSFAIHKLQRVIGRAEFLAAQGVRVGRMGIPNLPCCSPTFSLFACHIS